MANYRVAKRYAKAFMETLPTDKIEGAVNEMKQLSNLMKQSKDLISFMKSPIISNDKKIAACQEVFSSFSKESLNLIQLLIKNGRGENIKEVATEVINRYREENGIKKAVITSARPLNDQQIEEIVSQVKRNLASDVKIEVENKVNQELIGGFILRVDDQQFDASLRTKLSKIRQEFDTNHHISKI